MLPALGPGVSNLLNQLSYSFLGCVFTGFDLCVLYSPLQNTLWSQWASNGGSRRPAPVACYSWVIGFAFVGKSIVAFP